MSGLKVPGKEFPLGGRLLVLAPLNVAAVKLYRDEIKTVFAGTVPDIELVAKLTLASLQRNYPDITADFVDEAVDYGNFFDLWEVLLNLSGMAIAAGNVARRVQEQMDAAGLKS